MKISSFHYFRLQPYDQDESELFDYELECIQMSEELGFDGVWLAEHHFRSDVCSSTLSFASYVAAQTKRIRIGLGILLLPFYNAIRLAEDVAVVDLLSKGRLDVGLGRGYNPLEFEGFSVPESESRERFADTLDILRQAWTRDSVNFHGKFHDISDVRVFPKPLQKPFPPLWVGATSAATVKQCGEWGIPFMSDPAQTFEDTAALAGIWSTAAMAAGHDTSDAELLALRPMWVAETMEEALAAKPIWVPQSLEEARVESGQLSTSDPFDRAHEASSPKNGEGVQEAKTITQEISENSRYIVGDPDTVLRKLRDYHDAGYRHVIGLFNSGTKLPLETVRKSMELFSREVLSEVHNW